MVFVKGTEVQQNLSTSDEGDDTSLTDVTGCMSDDSTGVSCVECKIDEKQIKFRKDTQASVMSSVTMDTQLNSIMTAGTNTFYAYSDGNSVTTTGKVEYSGDLGVGSNTLALTQALLDEIHGGGAGEFEVRLISEFGSKNKVGEMEIEYTAPLIDIIAESRDDDDNIVGSVGVVLLRRTGTFPYTYTQIDSATTNGSGLHTFSYEDDGEIYRVFYMKELTPDQWDMSDEVQGV